MVAMVLDDNGNPVQLGPVIGQGGEGIVYELLTNPSLVAKLYRSPLQSARADKLSAMAGLGTSELLKFAAWPVSTLHKDNRIVGILMRKIAPEDRPIHELYTPKTRLRAFPSANWKFLIHVAANVARGFANIHELGHVIGDVNHGNILVGGNGITAFIDCDSFQLTVNGRVFICEVGVSTYTPPELQNREFKSVQRTRNHDAFGLAVLIFHLLFLGRHPFAGRFNGLGEMPIERAIAECRFPFGRLANQAQMSPPPNSLMLNQIPSPLADAFERAFSLDASKGAPRPAALEWLQHLEKSKTDLTPCSAHKEHWFFSKLSACPWCVIESRGIILFIEVGAQYVHVSNIDELWKRLSALPSLAGLPPLPTVNSTGIRAAAMSVYQLGGRDRKMRTGLGIAIVLLVVAMISVTKLDASYSILLILGSAGFAWLLPRGLQQEHIALGKALWEHQRRYSELQVNYSSQCGDQCFASRLPELARLREEYNSLPLQRQRKLQAAEQNKYPLQLFQFLDKFSINDASIPKIGVGRKQMLASYGVDTAADITPANLYHVPGIGPVFADQLVKWRAGLATRFVFDPNKPIDKLEIEKIDREIRSRGTDLEKLAATKVSEAITSHEVILSRRKLYGDQAVVILRDLVQAEANYKAS
jgi:DNA-binding helix-hairpin-helix protein with protein kinase domain